MDQDGVENDLDNCPETFNPKTDDLQADLDGDNIGDACDDDLDGDGKSNVDDPCPAKADTKGLEEVVFAQEECFPDTDKDGRHDFIDNCPRVANPNQENMDGDKWGDKCDPDVDDDQIMNKLDNCVDVANPDQHDLDRDGVGEACDKSFCFVVHGDLANCLDPKAVFSVYSPSLSAVIGDAHPVNLRLFANRRNHAMSYTWTVEKAPAGSTASITAPTGSVEQSSPYEYRYNQFPTIRPDMAGDYVIKITAQSRFSDAVSGEVGKVAVYTMRLKAEGESEAAAGGCSATAQDSGFSGFALLFLAGIGAFGVRRRRR
jgi:MYXO-CTERM domain-containing protein